jgi:futalosine hydrolase
VAAVETPGEAVSGVLFVVAAPAEAAAVRGSVVGAFDARLSVKDATPVLWRAVTLAPGVEMVVTGVGKANAAAGVARVFDPARHGVVVSLGVGGALPRSKLKLLDVVVATRSEYADEGVVTPGKFVDIAACGFGPGQGIGSGGPGVGGMGVDGDAALAARLATALQARAGVVATVSTCSGRNRAAVIVVERTGAIVEAMEGAAVGFTVKRMAHEAAVAVPFVEVRVVSNSTGNRARQRWDLKGALALLGEVARGIVGNVAG